MIELFPGPFVFHTQISNHGELKKKFLPQINRLIKDKSELLGPNNWKCDCKTSFFEKEYSKSLLNDIELVKSIVWDPLDQMLSEARDMDGGLCTQQIKYGPSESSLGDLWFNQYDKGQFQEPHDHAGGTYKNVSSTFSGIYLLELNETNTTTFMAKVGNPHSSFQLLTNHITEGSVIIFPSSLTHYVSPVKTRKTSISFNIYSSCDNTLY